MKITYLPHALERMEERGISEEEVRDVLERPDLESLEDVRQQESEDRRHLDELLD